MPFSKLDLSDQLVQGILATGYTAPTAIQSQAIPLAVTGRDIIGVAKTGTGKTAAFVLPMLNHLTKQGTYNTTHHARALVLTPTRELALQAEEFIITYGRFTNIQSLTVIGGVSMDNQVKRLRHGVDIIIATPGRLNDHLNRHTADLSKIEILVLDEADRMFDMGFINDVRKIIARMPVKRQTLLFSATMSKEVKALTASIQKNPSLIEIGEQRRPVETVAQAFYTIPQDMKIELLLHLLGSETIDSALVFSRTKHGADKITRRLERNGVQSVAIHSNRTQAQRQRALAGFKQGHYKVLVATDIAARGIDVEGISHVINYDTPTFAEDYIHRIGRTGRATATGDAITFVSAAEQKFVKSIEKYVGRRYDVKRYEGFDYTKKESPVAETKSMQHGAPHHRHEHPSGSKHQGHDGSERNRKPHRFTAHPLMKKKSYGLKVSFGKKELFERKESIESRERSWRKLFRREK
ncbi:MAG: DEAD/DEAH box helicase [Bacteroidota bacterium]